MRSIKKKKNKVSDVTEINNLIMKVDDEVDALQGAAHPPLGGKSGYLFSFLPHCPIFVPSIQYDQYCEPSMNVSAL